LSDGPVLAGYPGDIEVLEYLSGKKTVPAALPVRLSLQGSGGGSYPDLLTYLLPIFSGNVKEILEKHGADNIDYFPVEFCETETLNNRYWLANIIGLLDCLNEEKSDVKIHRASNRLVINSFFDLDEDKTDRKKIFRIKARQRLIIVSEELKNALETANLYGITITNAKNFEGF